MPVAAYLGPEEPDTVLHKKQTSILCNSLLNWQELARLCVEIADVLMSFDIVP